MNLDIMTRIAEGKIQEAIEEGKFDNLPGKGKPLVFDEDPLVPVSQRMANKVLKNAGVLPDWIQLRNDVLAEREEIARLLARLTRDNQTMRARLTGLPTEHPRVRMFAEWHQKSRADYHRRLKGVNSSILKFSLMAPSTAAPFTPYRIDEEMAAFDEAFPPLQHQPAVVLREPERESTLRGIARARYQDGEGSGPLRRS